MPHCPSVLSFIDQSDVECLLVCVSGHEPVQRRSGSRSAAGVPCSAGSRRGRAAPIRSRWTGPRSIVSARWGSSSSANRDRNRVRTELLTWGRTAVSSWKNDCPLHRSRSSPSNITPAGSPSNLCWRNRPPGPDLQPRRLPYTGEEGGLSSSAGSSLELGNLDSTLKSIGTENW